MISKEVQKIIDNEKYFKEFNSGKNLSGFVFTNGKKNLRISLPGYIYNDDPVRSNGIMDVYIMIYEGPENLLLQREEFYLNYEERVAIFKVFHKKSSERIEKLIRENKDKYIELEKVWKKRKSTIESWIEGADCYRLSVQEEGKKFLRELTFK